MSDQESNRGGRSASDRAGGRDASKDSSSRLCRGFKDNGWWHDRSRPVIILMGIGFGILGLGLMAFFGWVVMALWIWLMPDLFGLKRIAPAVPAPLYAGEPTACRRSQGGIMRKAIRSRQEDNMSKVSKYFFLLAVAGCLLLAQPLMAAEGIKGNLVNVNWLEKNFKNADVLILDASSAQNYAAQHIPGAVSVDIYAWYGLQDMPVADMDKLFQSWGISPGKKIVMYDQGGTMLATRLFYSLYYYGFPVKDLLILDGGLFKWQEAGLPVTKDVTPVPKKGSFAITKLNQDVKVELPEFLTASGDPAKNVLLEALGANWHFGEILAFDRAGHIPHGILLPSADFFNPDKTFKSAEEITRMLIYLSIRPEQRIYTYCGGGVAASVPFFALKFILNYPKVKLYTESELGWLSDERELPYWTYDAPFLMRQTSWLKVWGGQMMRTVGLSRVSIVDVRPADAFNQGHVPFALNVPGDVFKSNIANPGKLAEILGAAGVDASHEAV
ncbi:MAG: rhodanese-like domain-containing protein, partial [Candidatus Aminicenantes bacterium]|nr:rhodanese-like domain-containing protein [Candidatus Aminicenantes bacterium]